jgi:hypothetical protein
MILVISILVGIAAMIAVLLPFFVGKGGRLALASYETSPERLRAMKRAILDRYLKDEGAFKSGLINQRTWSTRQQFLTNKYLDASRRLDFLEYSAPSQPESGRNA